MNDFSDFCLRRFMCRMHLYSLTGTEITYQVPEKNTKCWAICHLELAFIIDYAILLEIFQKYEIGTLMKLPKSTSSGLHKLDCKGSHFCFLRNLDAAVTSQIQVKVRDGALSLSQLNKACQEAKKLRDLKKTFLELVGLSTWTEAKAKYPHFATEEKIMGTRKPVNVQLQRDSTLKVKMELICAS
uniref:Uncharacterized protein n=1 Tax=Amphimedon queenslandica TaxID=400682 RepID=A0A1X7UDE0_AMPQE